MNEIWDSEAWFHVRSSTEALTFDEAVPPPGVTAVARLDGAAIGDSYKLFEDLVGQWHFPAYFGWSWDALSDCLADLEWLRADRYLVAITSADRMLSRERDARGLLFKVLAGAAKSWSNSITAPSVGVRNFKIFLTCEPENVTLLRQELALSAPGRVL